MKETEPKSCDEASNRTGKAKRVGDGVSPMPSNVRRISLPSCVPNGSEALLSSAVDPPRNLGKHMYVCVIGWLNEVRLRPVTAG